MGVEKKTTINNGKRIDRFNNKKNRKDALKSDTTNNNQQGGSLIQTLAQNGLLQVDFDGELKVAPSTNSGWLAFGKKDEGDGGSIPSVTIENHLSLDGILGFIGYTSGPIVNGIAIYELPDLTSPVKTGEYFYFLPNATTAQSMVSIMDGFVMSIVEIGGPPRA
jgi:hypothetical protein